MSVTKADLERENVRLRQELADLRTTRADDAETLTEAIAEAVDRLYQFDPASLRALSATAAEAALDALGDRLMPAAPRYVDDDA